MYQLSEDKNWFWNTVLNSWSEIPAGNMPQETVAKVLTANGLN